MTAFDYHTATRLLTQLAAHGVVPDPEVSAALAGLESAQQLDAGPRERELVKAAADALRRHDDKEYDQAVGDAATRRHRQAAHDLLRNDARREVVRTFTMAVAGIVERLKVRADELIATIGAGADLHALDPEQLLDQGRSKEARTLAAARAAAAELCDVYRLRDELLGLPAIGRPSGVFYTSAWRRAWSKAGDWRTFDGRRKPGHPGNPHDPDDAGFLHGVATGGRLEFATTSEAVARNVAELDAAWQRAVEQENSRRGIKRRLTPPGSVTVA